MPRAVRAFGVQKVGLVLLAMHGLLWRFKNEPTLSCLPPPPTRLTFRLTNSNDAALAAAAHTKDGDIWFRAFRVQGR